MLDSTDSGTTEGFALAAECLTLVTGIFPRRPPTVTDIRHAEKLLGKAERAIKELLAADKPESYEFEAPPEQGELLQDLSTPSGSADWVNQDLPVETLPAWIMKVNEARTYCAQKWPRYDEKALTPSFYELAEDELGDIWEIVRAVDSADTVLSELRSATLSPSQVEALATLFPNYYNAVIALVNEALVDVALRSDPTLNPFQEEMVRILKRLGDEEMIAASPGAPPAQAGKPSQPSKVVATSTPISAAIEARQQGATK